VYASGVSVGHTRVAQAIGTPLVEVVTVLDPQEKAVFDGMVTQLSIDDPQFARCIDRLERPPRQLRKGLAILLWVMAPMCVVVGGWTGFFLAVVATAYAARLMLKRPGLHGGPELPWWSLPRRKPGAAL
jgi:hypothetical protein